MVALNGCDSMIHCKIGHYYKRFYLLSKTYILFRVIRIDNKRLEMDVEVLISSSKSASFKTKVFCECSFANTTEVSYEDVVTKVL